jgi:hypothetical protein
MKNLQISLDIAKQRDVDNGRNHKQDHGAGEDKDSEECSHRQGGNSQLLAIGKVFRNVIPAPGGFRLG